MGLTTRIRSLTSLTRATGPFGAAATVIDRIVRPRTRNWPIVRDRVRGGRGLEVGGPSSRFRDGGILPIYPLVDDLDNTTFASRTIWEGELSRDFVFDDAHAAGRQYFLDGTELSDIADEAYDFVVCSHVLEHFANPLKALFEWHRVLRPAGSVIMVVPHGAYNFDHRRPTTTIEHLVSDYEGDVSEDDDTHFGEVVALHDVARDPPLGDRDELAARTAANVRYRAVHHHVFDPGLVRDLLEYAGFEVVGLDFKRPYDIIAVGDTSP